MSECPNALIIGAGKAGSTSLHKSHFPRQEGVEIYKSGATASGPTRSSCSRTINTE